MAVEKLILSKLVSSGMDEVITYIPPNGQKITPVELVGSVPESPKVRVKLIWDYGGTEEILWIIHNRPMPRKVVGHSSLQKTGDGVKKMALVLANGGPNDLDMSGYAELEKR